MTPQPAPFTYQFLVPQEEAELLFAAYCWKYGYDDQSGKTPAEYTRECLIEEATATVADYVARQAAEQADAAKVAAIREARAEVRERMSAIQ